MKAKINYRSKKTIIIISVAVVLLIAAIVGTVAFVKGNQDAAAAMTDDGTSTSQNDGANAGLPNNGDQNNGDDQNNNGTTLPEVGDNTNPADSNNNGNNGSTTNGGTTGTNGANGSNTGANAGTTTGTTTTGNNGANVPNQDYTQTTVIPGRDNVLVEQNTEIGWSPISVAAYTAASKLKVHKPDLDLQKYAYLDGDSLEELPVNTAVQKGETITYVIKITNKGNEDTNGIRTIDSIPEGTELTFVSEGGALNNDGKIVWKNDIKAGKTVTVSFKVVVTTDSIDLINNIAKVNGEKTPETKTPVITANKTAQVVTIVDKEEVLENRDAKVGETIRYTITAKNTTEVDGTTVIKDSIPDGTSFVDGTITEKGNFDKENGTITWNNVVVPAKGEVSVSFDVVVNEKTTAGEVVKSVSNTATVGNTPTEEVEIKVANITGEKKVSSDVANVGDTLTYTIKLINSGNGDGKVTVTDAIPEGTKIKVATTDGYDLETNTMTWKNVEVKAGKSVELTLEVVVEDNTSVIKNKAYVDDNKIPEEPETAVKHHYTVEHYTENLDGTYSKVDKDTVVSENVEIGTKVNYKNNNYEGFTFDDSKTENKDATVPDNNNLVVKLYYTRNSYSYTIKYVEEGNETNILKTTTGEAKYEEEIDVTKETFEGYTYVRQDKEKIKIDTTNNIATVYYTRNSYKVTYKYEGKVPTGASETPAEATYKYGASVTVAEDATAPGYTFSGWDHEDFPMPASDVVIKGHFTANDNTQYKVEHYLEDLDGKAFTLKDTETLAGTTDTTATATPKQYPGFTFNENVEGTKTSGTITGDGQLVLKLYYTRNSYSYTIKYVEEGNETNILKTTTGEAKYEEEIDVTKETFEGYTYVRQDKEKIKIDTTNNIATVYYTRNSYKVTYKYEGKVPTGASETPAEATYKYGASVTVAEDATAPGYTFSGWDHEDFPMPASDVVIKGSFTANDNTQYKVEHYLEDLDGKAFTLKDTETLAGTTDTTATATPKQYPGFTFNENVEGTKTSGTITGDGQLVLKLYYTRNSYSYTIKYVEEGNETNILKTTTGEAKYEEEIDVTKETFEGYTYVRQDKEKIKIDTTNNIATVYYTRNSYKVTYKYEGKVPTGASETPAEATYKYGASVTVAEDATAPGYTFSGWDHEDFPMPASDVVIKGSFTANDNTEYKVEHYLENLDGKAFTLKDTETLAGTTDTTATATPKQYPGFTFNENVDGTKTSGTITGDGQLVLKLYYTRNSYKVTYEYEGKVPTGASKTPAEATYKYGASVTVAEDATAPGYTFSGWDKKDFTMPASNVVIKGSFKANDNTEYKVEHYLENLEELDGEKFTLKDTETLAGTTDTTATATPKQYPGFTYDSTVEGTKTSGTITGDGQLVLKLYYTRNTYKYTVHYFYNGVEDENKAEEFEALYEEKINEYTTKNQGRYTEYNKESSNRTKEALLVIGTGSNYINIYYGTPNVTISKKVNETAVKVGDTLHYTIKVTETRGLVDASGINITDPIPEGLENVRNITHNGNLNEGNVEWNNLTITKNSSITLEFDATVSANTIGRTISNTANLGGTTSGNSNTVTTTVSELKAAVKEVKKGTTGKDAVNIVLVMDLSYSMQEKKVSDNVTTRLDAAKTAATKFINSIYKKDPESKVTVTVLTFNTANPLTTIKYVGTERCTDNDRWHLHWNCKKIDGVWYSKWEEQKVAIPYSGTSKLGFADKTNYGALVNEINNISLPAENPDGGLGTNVSAALDLTKTTIGDLKDNHSENSNVVILLSDGAPTTSYSGNSSSNNYEGLRNQASEIKGNPITTEFYSIQFGTEKGAEKLLKAMSSNNTVYTSNSIDSLVENFTNILDQNTTKDPIDTVNGKYTTTLSNPLVVDADNPITVTYKGTTLFTCTSLPNNGLTYDSTTKTLTWDINAWNAVEGHTKVTTNDIVIQCYVER